MAEFFYCPLCGRRRPISGWNPDQLPDQIVIQEVVGAGRGHGFTTLDQRNAVQNSGDLDLLALAKRCLRIVGLCLGASGVDASDLVDDVPSDLEAKIVEEKAEDYDYVKKDDED